MGVLTDFVVADRGDARRRMDASLSRSRSTGSQQCQVWEKRCLKCTGPLDWPVPGGEQEPPAFQAGLPPEIRFFSGAAAFPGADRPWLCTEGPPGHSEDAWHPR
jgi:hypothetical protein